ncbi:hypothetical protein ATANTOWER_027221 [Ataeniobius toweri]|uniref:Uncharacterized protein n=1 Tax=Ataeniobius toweri TaxID=208326 RepID=A0ABU7BXY4_9TELE|nr:hypothetical protein [Ataeniobius toweri]
MLKLPLGTCNVTSLWRKEPELVREVKSYRLEILASREAAGWGGFACPHPAHPSHFGVYLCGSFQNFDMQATGNCQDEIN